MKRRTLSILFCLGFMAACASAPAPEGSWIDFAALEPGLATNRALACAPDICTATKAYSAAAEFPASPQTLADVLLRFEPGAQSRTEANGDIRVRWVAVTPAFRFRDDVDVLLRPSAGQTTRMAVYSRSRVGLSDLGTNARRIDDLSNRLAREVEG